MYDIFIDEEKTQGYIGFLVTKNTPALQQILFNVREANQNYRREIKFVTVNNSTIHIILSWLNIFFTNSYNTAFFYRKWDGTLSNKKNIITKTLNQIKTVLNIKKNLIVFMDFDTNDKNLNLQSQIRKNAKITRCYHIDSKAFDMIQLTDILLQCAIKSEKLQFNRNSYSKLLKRRNQKVSMKKTELKKLIVYHAIKQNIKNKKIRKKVA